LFQADLPPAAFSALTIAILMKYTLAGIFASILIGLQVPSLAQPFYSANPANSARFYPGKFQSFLKVSGEYGVVSQPVQPGMASYRTPIDVSLEYGKNFQNFKIIGGFITRTGFSQDIFILKPRMAYLGGRYYLQPTFFPDWFRVSIALAAVGWQTILTDESYDGIILYRNKEEKDQGLGGLARLGFHVEYGAFSFGPQVSWFFAPNGYYLAGAFEKQAINPGYYWLGLNLGYRFALPSLFYPRNRYPSSNNAP
jgi:hypothetical protein